MIPTVSFIGHHNSGKTRLLAQLIPLLTERGYRVGAVKHAPHLDEADVPGSDSAIHLDAGANRVLLRSSSGSALYWRHEEERLEDGIDRLFAGCDLVLIEGCKRGPFPKIEVFRYGREIAREPLAGEIDVVAVVTEDRAALPDDVALLSPHDLHEVGDFVEALLFGEQA